jgi:hypothetical protein
MLPLLMSPPGWMVGGPVPAGKGRRNGTRRRGMARFAPWPPAAACVPAGLDNSHRWGSITGMNTRITVLLAVLFLLVVPAGLFAASFAPLLPLLVDLAGWQAEKAEGIDLSQAGMQGVTVVREYQNGEKTINASIMLGSQVGTTWIPDYKEGFKAETTEGSVEVRTINGFLVYLGFDKSESTGGLVVLLIGTTADKPESGALFVFSFEGLALDEALKTAQKFDWKKMKDVAGKVK